MIKRPKQPREDKNAKTIKQVVAVFSRKGRAIMQFMKRPSPLVPDSPQSAPSCSASPSKKQRAEEEQVDGWMPDSDMMGSVLHGTESEAQLPALSMKKVGSRIAMGG